MGGKKYLPLDDAIIRQMWDTDATLPQIAAALPGRTPGGISMHARTILLLEPRQRGRPRKHDWREIGRLLDQGMCAHAVARQIGASYGAVRRVRDLTCAPIKLGATK